MYIRKTKHGNNILSIEPYDLAWIKRHKLDLQAELERTRCIRTRKHFNGFLGGITIACIESPEPHLIWWFKNPRNRKK